MQIETVKGIVSNGECEEVAGGGSEEGDLYKGKNGGLNPIA